MIRCPHLPRRTLRPALRHARRIVAVASIALLPWTVPPADAAVIVVDSSSDQLVDDTRCTLREAIESANQDIALFGCTTGSGADIVELAFDAKGVSLSLAGANEDANQTGDLDITEDLTIRSVDADDVLTIDADAIDRVLDVFPGVDLTLESVRVSGGDVIPFGGGIFVRDDASTLRLVDSFVVANQASLFGGGIYSPGPVVLERSRVESNDATTGGGIFMASDAILTLDASQLKSNRATTDGGGASLLRLAARDSTIDGNRADRDGGGIAWQNGGDAADVSTMVNSTVAENSSFRDGGGLFFNSAGILDLYNVTVAWNLADEDGDDIGTGGGVVVATGQVRPRNSLVASNFDVLAGGADLDPDDCSGTLTSLGNNLFGAVDGASCTIAGTTVGNVTGTPGSPVDAELGCLAQIGTGPGTVAPAISSPVVDAGAASGCLDLGGGVLDVDQRGHLRPWDGPDLDTIARCDIGAVEVAAPGPGFFFGDGFENGETDGWTSSVGEVARVGRGGPSRRGGGGGGAGCFDPE